ncbi:MAG: LamG-like jellyroll fold domain-containing protein [Planctomycetota bacterium]
MNRELIAFLVVVVLLGLVNGAAGSPPDIEFRVDFAYPLIDPCDPCNVERHEKTAKEDWWIWQAPAWRDMWSHDPVWEDGSQGPAPANPNGIDGTGIHAKIDIGYDGDTTLKVFGMEAMGDGLEPNGMPVGDPICNSEIVSHRHRGAGFKGDDGSVYLTFTMLPRGTYELSSYHNDRFFRDPNTPDGWGPLDPCTMPSILVTGDGVIQTQDANSIEVQAETSDANLVLSVVAFETDGSNPAIVEYVTSPVGGQYYGGAAVLNAFILRGWKAPEAFWPKPPDGATDVHPDVVLTWRPGAHAVSHEVYFGTDIDEVSDAADPNSLPGRGRQDPNWYDPPGPLNLGVTYYWRIDEVNDAHPDMLWKGDAWSFTVDDGKAHSPSPENGATNVPLDANLTWSPGSFAAWHYVYLGTDAYDVLYATDPNTPPGRGRENSNSYDPCGLELNKTYYWRIDEANPGYDNSKGDLWFFTTTQCTVVDNMESYDDVNRIYYTWGDGAVNGTGSIVDLAVAPLDPVHDGSQSMLYIYDTNDPYSYWYAEAEASIADLEIGPDWTVQGVKALTLFFYGDPNNDANDTEQMYVGLQDTRGAAYYRELRYGDNGEDMNDLKKAEWTAYNIELEDFNQLGVDLTDVEKIYIGFGDRVAQEPGGSGVVYFDDIRLCLPRCIASIARPEGDLNNDCIVDYRDARIMAADWLDRDLVAVRMPDANGLLVEYTFDNNDYNDTSGNAYHGSPGGDASISDGNLVLPGTDYSYVAIPLGSDNPFDGTKDYSIQMTFTSSAAGEMLMTSSTFSSGPDDRPMMLWRPGGSPELAELHIWYCGGPSTDGVVDYNDGMSHTLVVAYDAVTQIVRFYSDGFEDGSSRKRYWMPAVEDHLVRIGACASRNFRNDMGAVNLVGEVDSVRIYDYPLSQLEAMYLATDGTGILPIQSPANLYNEEPPGSRVINIRDYAVLALNWLQESFWP